MGKKSLASKYTKSARGKVCQMRLEGCLPGTETVVFAHLNGAGMGLKNEVNGFPFGFFCCMSCHDLYDRRKEAKPPYDPDFLDHTALRATICTQKIMIKEGVLKL